MMKKEKTMKMILNTNKFRSGRRGVIGNILFIGLFSLSSFSWGDTVSPIETVTNINVTCANTGQLCEPPFFLEIQTGGLLQINYMIPPTHCSSVRMHVLVDGVLKATTGFLGWVDAPLPFDVFPLETGLIDLGPLSPGAHLLALQAEGEEGGCNTAQPSSWGGTLHVFTTPNTVIGGSISGKVMGGEISRMRAWTGKVICQNLTTKKTKKLRIKFPENASSWDCKQVGLVINSGDKVQMKVNVNGYAE